MDIETSVSSSPPLPPPPTYGTLALETQQQQQQQQQQHDIYSTVVNDDEFQAQKRYTATRNTSHISWNYRERCSYWLRFGCCHSIYLLLVNTMASTMIFACHLISYESVFSATLGVGLTMYIYYHQGPDINGSSMNWVLLTFAVITPIASSITMAYTRRELALRQISSLRSTLLSLYTAYAIWGWDYERQTPLSNNRVSTNGRTKSIINWLEHSDLAMREIFYVCDDLTRLLTLPSDTRARHTMTHSGRIEATMIRTIHTRFLVSIVERIGHLSEICETLKQEGLPPNESNRIRQWERGCLDAIEQLRVIKVYRTPQGLRSFGRLFSTFLPPFYAPYYAQLAHDVNLGIAITFAILTAIALTSLFETISQMEDPFDKSSLLDGVHVQADLIDGFQPLLLALRNRYFPGCPPFDYGK